jgi:nicotinamidase-related amidase
MEAYFKGLKKTVTKQMEEVFLGKDHAAVITIDMHEGHLSTDPDCPCPCPRGREIINPLNSFTEQCRKLGIPVIHVRSVVRADGADEKLFPSAWRITFPFVVGEIPGIAEHAKEGTKWNQFSVTVKDTDYIVSTKKRLSAFYPTDLELLLRNLGIRTIVLTGCMTECCVLNTAFDGANRDFRIVVPKDLTRGTKELEEAALEIISMNLGLVVDSEELLSYWGA